MKNKILKILIIILDVIVIPLLIIQATSGNFNISGFAILIVSNIIVLTSTKDKK